MLIAFDTFAIHILSPSFFNLKSMYQSVLKHVLISMKNMSIVVTYFSYFNFTVL